MSDIDWQEVARQVAFWLTVPIALWLGIIGVLIWLL